MASLANMNGAKHFEINDLNSVTLEVTWNFTRRMIIKRWIATRLIMLAALILGCRIEFNDA